MKKITLTVIFCLLAAFFVAAQSDSSWFAKSPIKRYYAGALCGVEAKDFDKDGVSPNLSLRLGMLLNFKLFRNVSFGSKLIYDPMPGRFIGDGNLQWKHSNGDWMVRVGRMPTVMWFLHDPDGISQAGQFIAPAEAAIPALRNGIKVDYKDFRVGFYPNRRDSLEFQAGYENKFQGNGFFKKLGVSGSYSTKEAPLTSRAVCAAAISLDTKPVSATFFVANGDKQTASGIVVGHLPHNFELVATGLYKGSNWEHLELLFLKVWDNGPHRLSYMLGTSYQEFPFRAGFVHIQVWINS